MQNGSARFSKLKENPQITKRSRTEIIIKKYLQMRRSSTGKKEDTMKNQNNQPKKKKTAGDIVLTLVLVVAIGVFCFAAYNLYHIYTEYKKGSDEYNQIAQMAVTERDPDKDSEAGAEAVGPEGPSLKPPMDIDFDSLRNINPDVIGWIYVEALDGVSYPIVKGTDND